MYTETRKEAALHTSAAADCAADLGNNFSLECSDKPIILNLHQTKGSLLFES